MEKKELLELLTKNFKNDGFFKKNKTWHKAIKDVTLVCDVQVSQWNNNDFYINIGIIVRKLDDIHPISTGNLHLWDRIDQKKQLTIDKVYSSIQEWFSHYDTLEKIETAYKKKQLPSLVRWDLRKYLENLK